jgi:D-tyrosyl-tRNA(Tyr) deacylase
VGGYDGLGLCVLLGVGHDDTPEIAVKMATKLLELRCFEDSAGKTNLNVGQIGANVCVISQFTLYADTSRGRRPSWTDAAPPSLARPLVDAVAQGLEILGANVSGGAFGANMRVALTNEGPMTLIINVD